MMDPTGMWVASVRRPRGTTKSTFVFARNGIVLLTKGGVGGGTWSETEPGRFAFRIAEPRLDEQGGYEGWVDIVQDAFLEGDAFTSWGVSTVYDASGAEAYRADVCISAVRSHQSV